MQNRDGRDSSHKMFSLTKTYSILKSHVQQSVKVCIPVRGNYDIHCEISNAGQMTLYVISPLQTNE